MMQIASKAPLNIPGKPITLLTERPSAAKAAPAAIAADGKISGFGTINVLEDLETQHFLN